MLSGSPAVAAPGGIPAAAAAGPSAARSPPSSQRTLSVQPRRRSAPRRGPPTASPSPPKATKRRKIDSQNGTQRKRAQTVLQKCSKGLQQRRGKKPSERIGGKLYIEANHLSENARRARRA
eukprot:GHVT01061324.1.p3 GENE.GHVT01061324.1~~GHVT01061324.1.p3  ORF type:complete len:121 (-),score=26.56 GHVT01061324.1:115-477(-)